MSVSVSPGASCLTQQADLEARIAPSDNGSLNGRPVICLNCSNEEGSKACLINEVCKLFFLKKMREELNETKCELRELRENQRKHDQKAGVLEKRERKKTQAEEYDTEIDTYCKEHLSIGIFHNKIFMKLDNAINSLSSVSGGYAQINQNTLVDNLNKLIEGLGALVPQPVSGLIKALNILIQYGIDKDRLDNIQQALEMMGRSCSRKEKKLMVYTIADGVATRLCERYEYQIKCLRGDGLEGLANFIKAAFLVFLLESSISLDSPVHEQFIEALQGREKTFMKKYAGKYYRLSTIDDDRNWYASELFVKCGIRTRQGSYYTTNGLLTTYGFRLGSEREALSQKMVWHSILHKAIMWKPGFPRSPFEEDLILAEAKHKPTISREQIARQRGSCPTHFDPSQSVDRDNWGVTMIESIRNIPTRRNAQLLFETVKKTGEYQKHITYFEWKNARITFSFGDILSFPVYVYFSEYTATNRPKHSETWVRSAVAVRKMIKNILEKNSAWIVSLTNPYAFNKKDTCSWALSKLAMIDVKSRHSNHSTDRRDYFLSAKESAAREPVREVSRSGTFYITEEMSRPGTFRGMLDDEGHQYGIDIGGSRRISAEMIRNMRWPHGFRGLLTTNELPYLRTCRVFQATVCSAESADLYARSFVIADNEIIKVIDGIRIDWNSVCPSVDIIKYPIMIRHSSVIEQVFRDFSASWATAASLAADRADTARAVASKNFWVEAHTAYNVASSSAARVSKAGKDIFNAFLTSRTNIQFVPFQHVLEEMAIGSSKADFNIDSVFPFQDNEFDVIKAAAVNAASAASARAVAVRSSVVVVLGKRKVRVSSDARIVSAYAYRAIKADRFDRAKTYPIIKMLREESDEKEVIVDENTRLTADRYSASYWGMTVKEQDEKGVSVDENTRYAIPVANPRYELSMPLD